jgi:hypothetical protein
MRLTILAAVACAALSGCDQTPTATAPVAPAAPQACNCQPAPAQIAQTSPSRPHRHRRHMDHYASEYSESDVSTYGYVSDSRSYSVGEDSGASAVRAGGGLWVDGYGRGYFTSGHAVRAGTMRGDRLKPWKGYDADCDR